MRPRRRRSRANNFGTVIPVGPGEFAIRWWEDGKRKWESGFKTRTEAIEGLARVRSGLSDGTLAVKRAAGVSFDVAAQEWLELHSKPNLRSHDDNVERYENHVKPFLGSTPMSAVTPAKILQLRAHLQTQKRTIGTERTLAKGARPVERSFSAGTINRVMALVRAILRFAVVNGHIQASPTDKIGRGRLLLAQPKRKLEPPVKSAKDVGRLLEAAREVANEKHRPGLYTLFVTIAYTGLRRGEACGLRWQDIDFGRRLITVRRSYEAWTKSGRERVVPMPEPLVAVLKEHKLADEWQGELVFSNDYGEMLSEDSHLLLDVLSEACDRCKIDRVRVHDLRKVFASFFMMAGGDIFTLQRILGHSTPQITSDTYAHLANDYLAGASDRVVFPTFRQTRRLLKMDPRKPAR